MSLRFTWPARLGTLCTLALLAVCGSGCSSDKDSVPGAPGSVVTPPSASLNPGQKLQFRTILLPPVTWQVAEGPGVVSAGGDYQAPYNSDGGPSATVRASSLGSHADASVTLINGPADRDACKGSAQNHLPAFGEYVFVEELPEALHRVSPTYPDSARIAGVQGTVMVAALVCSSGLVIETGIAASTPLLDSAAQTAVRQWVFAPARAGGEPVAVWVMVPVRFSLH